MHRPNAPSRNPHQVTPRGIIYAVTYATPPEPYAFKDYNGQIVMQPPQPVAGQRHPYSQVPAWGNSHWDYSYKNAYGHPMAQQQTLAPPAPQRKVLDIIDPTTGEKVDLTKVGVPPKNNDSAKEQIRAQFASKVAAVATPRKQDSEENHSSMEATHENGAIAEEDQDSQVIKEEVQTFEKIEEPVTVPKNENKQVEAKVQIQEHEQPMKKEQMPKAVPVPTVPILTPEPTNEVEEVEQTLDDNKGDNSDSEWKETKRNKKKKKTTKVETAPPQNLPKGNNTLNRQQKQAVNGVPSQVPSHVPAKDQPEKEVIQPRAVPAPAKPVPVWPSVKSNLVPSAQTKPLQPAQVPQQKPQQQQRQPQQQGNKPQQQNNPSVNAKQPTAPVKQQQSIIKNDNDPKSAAAGKRKSKEKNRNKKEVPKAKTPEPTKASEEVLEPVATPVEVVHEPVTTPKEVSPQLTKLPMEIVESKEENILEIDNLASQTKDDVQVEEAMPVEAKEVEKEVLEVQELEVNLATTDQVDVVEEKHVVEDNLVEETYVSHADESQDVTEVEEVVTEEQEIDEKKDLKPAGEDEEDLEDGEIIDDDDDIREDNAQMMKFNYSEDQWSPLNPEGSKKYNRDFLIQIQQSLMLNRPSLPDLDIVLREPHMRHVQGILGHPPTGPLNDFASYVRQNSNSYNNRSQNRGQHRGQYDGRKIIEHKMFDNVTLHKTEDAWQKHRQHEKDESTKLFNNVRGILNKLTPQQFDALMEQVRSFNIDSESKLAGCISLLFEQCVKQPIFSGLYARMAKCFSMLAVPSDEDSTKNVTFRKLLLTKCQQEFEQDKENEKEILALSEKIEATEAEEERKQLEEQKSEAMTNAKRRSLGNIRFIGELYKLAMLTENIMHECLLKLLRGYEDEDNIECLCKLLTTIGKDIENSKSKAKVETYFVEMKRLVDEKKTTTRIRFMMMDVIDLRKGGWMPKRNEGPKTIEQIHKEVEKEKMETQRRMEDHSGRNVRRHTKHSGLVPSANVINEDGWTSVSRTMKSQTFDASKMKLTRMDDNVQLGPGRNSWNKGSTGGVAKDQNMLMPTNRYSLLSNSTEEPSRNYSNSKEQERFTGRHSGYATYSQERPSSGDRSNERQQISMESKAPLPLEKKVDLEIPREDMEKKVKSRVEEYLMLKDIKEAIETVKELNTIKCFQNAMMFFYLSIEQNIEKSTKIREEIGVLHLNLLKIRAVPTEAYAAALKKLTKYADDIAVDIPQFWKYVGEIVSPVFLDGMNFKLNILVPVESGAESESDDGVESEDSLPRLFAEVLNAVSHKMGHHQATGLWESSGLKWEELVKSQPVADFLKKFKVDYTVGTSDVARKRHRLISVNENKNELIALFSKQDTTVEEIHDWIFDNLHLTPNNTGNPADLKSASDCCTALCMSCLHKRSDSALNEYDLDEERMKMFLCVIKTLTVDKQQRQLEVLFGLQELFHRLSYPKDLLHRLFELLFDAEVLNEVAFHQWRDDTTQTVGKGVAIASVSRFYNWIVEEEKDFCEES